jgi:uncharacterized membrane protein
MAEGTGRTDAFSDGVFAIAITLLILEIKVPHAGAAGGLWHGLRELWPSYVAFVLSFFVVLIMWVNHHELMRLVRGVTYPFLFANGLVLLTVTFVPFPTAILAEHLPTADNGPAVAFYCGTFVFNSLAWGVLLWSIRRDDLFRADVDPDTIGRIRRAYIAGPPVYLIATLVAMARPWWGLALNVSVWLLWIRLCYRTAMEVEHVSSRSAAASHGGSIPPAARASVPGA